MRPATTTTTAAPRARARAVAVAEDTALAAALPRLAKGMSDYERERAARMARSAARM
jgi:hypothetical protein